MSDSILSPGQNCWRVTRASRAAFLVDAADYFNAFASACAKAQRTIYIVGWDFDTRMTLSDKALPDGLPSNLGKFLGALVRRNRKLRIHILTWDFAMIYALDRDTAPLFGMGWHPHRRIHFRYDDHHPMGGCHHQKVVVIDDKVAFSGGLDLTHGRWDTREHLAQDPMRINPNGEAYPPFHDVQMVVAGETAAALGDLARERWRRVCGKALKTVSAEGDPWPDNVTPLMTDATLGIARTEPEYKGQEEVREIEQLYLDMIRAAEKTLYIENQYFTSAAIGEALEARLKKPDCPEIIAVLRQENSGWLEAASMGTLRAQLIERLRKADIHKKFFAYYPVCPNLHNSCINVHAKVMIVDDKMARVASSNLNNRSMGVDTECDLMVEADRPEIAQRIASFRDDLLAEHLGMSPVDVTAAIAREGSVAAFIECCSGERTLKRLDPRDSLPAAVTPIVSIWDSERPAPFEKILHEFAVTDQTPVKKPHVWLKVAGAIFFLVVLAAIWKWTPLREYANLDVVWNWLDSFSDNPLAPVMVIVAYIVASFILFPRPLITLATVLSFGPWQGFAYAMVGILAASLFSFWLGTVVGRDWVRRVAGPRLNRLMNLLRDRGFIGVLALRLVPVAPFVVVNMVAGAARLRVRDFSLGTIAGMLPGTLTIAFFGGSLKSILHQPKMELVAILLVLGVLAIGLLYWLRKRFGDLGEKNVMEQTAK